MSVCVHVTARERKNACVVGVDRKIGGDENNACFFIRPSDFIFECLGVSP